MIKLNSIHLEYLHLNIYYTYLLLYCKGHIQMTSNDITINVKTKKTIRMNKLTNLHSIHLKLHYNISHIPSIILQRTHSDDK